ncbi:MAG: hypothetical protein WCD69_13065, partial [Xanthobacteraceae bacterium]
KDAPPKRAQVDMERLGRELARLRGFDRLPEDLYRILGGRWSEQLRQQLGGANDCEGNQD